MPRAVKPLRFGNVGGGLEGVPCQIVDFGGATALAMHHEQADVIAGKSDIIVGQQAAFQCLLQMVASGLEHGLGRAGMPPNATNIGFNGTNGQHRNTSFRVRLKRIKNSLGHNEGVDNLVEQNTYCHASQQQVGF